LASNAQKTPFGRSINTFAERKAREAIALLGKGLPCSVVEVASSASRTIVTVKFELDPSKIPFTLPQVTVPMFGPEWIRYPTQPGDTGVVIPFDARLGGITGLGAGVASLVQPANLGALVFMPIANSNWDAPADANKLVLYGPDGAVIHSKTNPAVNITVTDTEIQLNSPLIMMNGFNYLLHKHSGVSVGFATSGGVVP
jgi:hypothetical protein